MTRYGFGKDWETQIRMIAALREGKGLPVPASAIKHFETHISWIFLVGENAYKIKKAINLGFLDFSTLDRRRFYCQEEIRLNRRMAPEIYLDVVSIGGTPDAPILGAQPAMEYAVRMRRFSSDVEMDALIESCRVQPAHVDHLAETVARFHNDLPSLAPEMPYGESDVVRDLIRQNFTQLPDDFLGVRERQAVAALQTACDNEWLSHRTLIDERRQQGFVRECHGDLHLGNIAILGERAVPFDGIEFEPTLRWIDIVCDIAFPFMDFQHFGRIDFAYRLLNRWLELTGDYAGLILLPLYASYRAAVRAKVSAIRAVQPGISQENGKRAQEVFYRYLSLARACLAPRRPMLIITHGLPGSGKTTFSQMALERLGAIRIRSDVERKRLFGMGPDERSRSAVKGGIYTQDITVQTYQALHDIAERMLRAGYPVIVDAAFLKFEEREQFRRLADQRSVPFVIAAIEASDVAMRERIQRRMEHGRDASEADVTVLEVLQAAYRPLQEQERSETITFQNNGVSGFADNELEWKALAKRMD